MDLITSAVLLFVGAFGVWLLSFRKDKSSTDLKVVTAMEKVADSWKARAQDAQEKIEALEQQIRELQAENRQQRQDMEALSLQIQQLLRSSGQVP